MNKTRFSLYKTWFYFGVGQAPGHPQKQGTMIVDAGLQLRHCDKGKIECQTLVINITAINKSIKLDYDAILGLGVLFKNRIIKPDTASPG
jgi:hypothetical protein